MIKYAKEHRFLQAVDCIVFGFDAGDLKVLLIQRGFEPEKGKWSVTHYKVLERLNYVTLIECQLETGAAQ